MSLQRRAYVVATLFAMIGLTLSGLILYVSSNENEVKRDFEIVQMIRAKVADFRTVGVEYALYREKRPKLQSEAMLQAISPLLEQLRKSSVFQREETVALLQNAFDQLGDCVAIMSALSTRAPDPSLTERERLMTTQFLLRGAALASATGDLTLPLLARANHIQEMSQFVVITSVFFLLGLPLVAILLLRRAILHPLTKLANAVRAVGAGNLDIRLRTNELGELGRLARAFDWMLDRIQDSTNMLVVAKDAAETASRAKSSFLANMSHEIRTPMNAVLGLVYLLEQTELTQVQRDYVLKTQASAQALLGILNDILDLSKVEAERLELEMVPFLLDDLMDTLATITAANARDKNIEVLFHTASGAPNILYGDALRLQQVLLNLTGNAIKFTNQGEVVLSVEPVAVGLETVRLAFSVRDTGIGIAPDQINAIFDPFTQADASTTRQYGGTGLGLAISKRLIALMGGELSVESEPGRGSTFRFTANFRMGTAEHMAQVTPPELAGPLRVLIADDNPTARETMTTMVERFGWKPTVVDSGHETLAALDHSTAKGQPFDLILLDWVMPEIGGKEIVAHLHHHDPSEVLPVILVVTAFDNDRVRRDVGEDASIRVILTKPITPSVLLDAVSSAYSCQPFATPLPINKSILIGYTLLLVEDNKINQMVARRILESAGAAVEVVECGIDALDILANKGKHFDAVLMDIQMPGIDGYETCRRLRERPELANLPVIAMTANALPSDRERCLAAGMNDHIAKPLDVEQAIQTILRHVCRSEAKGALAEIDLKTAMFRCDGDGELLKQVMEEFIKQFSDEPEIMTHQLANGDWAAVEHKAHSLKGIAGSIGAVGLAKKAAQLQIAVRHGDRDLSRATGREVCGLLSIVLVSCSRWLVNQPSVERDGS